MRKISYLLILCISIVIGGKLIAQTPGTITITAMVLPTQGIIGKVKAATAQSTCTVSGNAAPATSVLIDCIVGSITIPTYTIPIPANGAYTFQQNYGSDSVTFVIKASAIGAITVQAVANGVSNDGVPF